MIEIKKNGITYRIGMLAVGVRKIYSAMMNGKELLNLLRSCFSSGKWEGEKPWIGEEKWK